MSRGQMHAGKQVRNPRKLRRIIEWQDSTAKAGLCRIMRDLDPGLTVARASEAYDSVTRAIHAWIVSRTVDLPKGSHARLSLRNCFSVNLCWMRGDKGTPPKYPDYPHLWITLGDPYGKPGARAHLRRLRLREWSKLKAAADQGQAPALQGL